MLIFLLMGSGLAFLVAGAELLVRGASRLAAARGISPLIIGLTIVAFGTSAPELAVSVASAMRGQPDIALGNVVGSNIFNVLFILGVSSLITPLVVSQRLIRIDVPLMVLVSCAVLLLAQDGRVSRPEGLFLSMCLLVYIAFCIRSSQRELPEVTAEYTQEFGPQQQKTLCSQLQQLGLIVVGLGLLVLGSQWLVDGTVALARLLGASELLIALTIMAAGTSLPEVATSVMAAVRGERDIAVGNVVGSNLFNLLGVLGLSAAVSTQGVAVAPQALSRDLPVMAVAAAACLPIFFSGHRINRWEGLLMLISYVAYTGILMLN